MVEDCSIDIMKEILDEGDIQALKELIEDEVKPLVLYRAKKEKEIAKQAIDELYAMEQSAIGQIQQKQVYNYLSQGVR